MPKKYYSDTNLKNINLLNLNDEEYDDCQYVLTSPRSLQACANLEIRPIELLTKTFREFGTMDMYEDYEKKRLRKLNACIEEREKLSANISGNSVKFEEDDDEDNDNDDVVVGNDDDVVDDDDDGDDDGDDKHQTTLYSSNLALVDCTRPKQMALVKRRKLNWKPTLDNIENNKNISYINNINYNNIHDTNYTNENDNNKRIMLYRSTSDDDRIVGFLKKRLETEGKMLQKQNRREIMEQKQRDWKDQYGHYLEIMQNKSDLISKQHFIRRRNSVGRENHRRVSRHSELWNKIKNERIEATNSIIHSIQSYQQRLEMLQKDRDTYLINSRLSNERLRLMREQLRRRRPGYDDFNEKDKQTKLELRHVYKNFHDDDC